MIHKITVDHVAGEPRFAEVFPRALEIFGEHAIASHTLFDRNALGIACEQADLKMVEADWVDTAAVARARWPQRFGRSGYGLKAVAKAFGIEFRHHDAGEDARVCAEILIRACKETGLTLEDWFSRPKPPRKRPEFAGKKVRRDGDPAGPLFGMAVVFTGDLSVPREEAADIAHGLGLCVKGSVSRKVSLLVVGSSGGRRPEWPEKSSKQLRAETLISEGHDMIVMSETDFFRLVREYSA